MIVNLESMPQKPGRANKLDSALKSNSYASTDSRICLSGIEDNIVPPNMLVFGNSRSSITLPNQLNGSLGTNSCELQANDSKNCGGDTYGELETRRFLKSDQNCGQEHPKLSSIASPTMSEHLIPVPQLKLVGHSAGCASYACPEPLSWGNSPDYGQNWVHSDFHGMHHSRMALPLELAEEPVYVNAKQYHGILRRRQLRAKAELENKVAKVRKPYLHESRHLHAMRRARGCGGRFLSKKNLDKADGNASSENSINCNVTAPAEKHNSLGSHSTFPIASQNIHFSAGCSEAKGFEFPLQEMQNKDTFQWTYHYQCKTQ
ncbi:hypothetical protein ACH5RR_007328 [Cinchona calisaya]|uniref:Nuclear transcription factor Y subunit n=1 Tax=Cinchona calisaya TaxID=153742 RepID=A0ABD3ARH0_9GENT